MGVSQKLREAVAAGVIPKAYHAIVKRYGPAQLKRSVWDSQYSAGKCRWDTAGRALPSPGARRDMVLDVIDRYARGGAILDLGCGNGFTALEIEDSFASYLGVDISRVAINAATTRILTHPDRAGRASFIEADVSTFAPPRAFDLILFRESIYYLHGRQVAGVLRRCARFLTQKGVFIVRLHDRVRYAKTVNLIESTYHVLEELAPANDHSVVLVFMPDPSSLPPARGCP